MAGKNIIWFKINILDDIFYINIETITYWFDSGQLKLIYQSVSQVIDYDNLIENKL